jgi:hypothetical protein
MALVPFDAVKDFSTALNVGPLAKGMNGTLFFEPNAGHSNLFQGPADLRQSYHIKPQGMNSTVKPGDKFEINLQVKGQDKFVAAMERLEDFVLASLYARKGEVLPKKADVVHSVDALRILLHSGRLIKAGAEDKTGGRYPDNLRLKVVGNWSAYVSGVTTKTVSVKGSERAMIDACEWAPRTTPVAANETRFYLWVRATPEGKDVYADKVVGPDGVQRLVGPQDAKPGCTITPVFSLSHVYVSESIGITATARALYIKPGASGGGGGGSGGEDGEFSATSSRAVAEVPLLGGILLEGAEEEEEAEAAPAPAAPPAIAGIKRRAGEVDAAPVAKRATR